MIPRSNSVTTSDLAFTSGSPTAHLSNRSNSISTSPTFPQSWSKAGGLKPEVQPPKVLHSLDSGDLRILLLENISQGAVDSLKNAGFQVEHHAKAWSEDDLVAKIGQYHAIGIRSKTKITARVLKAATKVSSLLVQES